MIKDDDAFEKAYARAAFVREHSEYGAQERARVAAIIERDRADAERDKLRRRANFQVRNGAFENFADTVQEPTPEWMSKGPTRPFTPRQPEGTVRVVKSVRRARSATIERLFERGKLSLHHLAACRWYQSQHEAAGLIGRWKTTHLSLAGPGSGGGNAQVPVAQHAAEAEAREEFRLARAAIPARLLRLFEAVVIDELPLIRAARFGRCRKGDALAGFKQACMALAKHSDGRKIDISAPELTAGTI